MNKPLLQQIFGYLRRPQPYNPEEVILKRHKAWNIFKLMSWSFLCAFPLSITIFFVLKALNYESTNSVQAFAEESSKIFFLFFAVILAPVREELAFRLFLRYKPYLLAFGTFFFLNFIIGLIIGERALSLPLNLSLQLGVPVGIALILFFVLKFSPLKDAFKNAYHKYFYFIFYTSALLFGFIHLTNYPDVATVLYISPILILPQLIMGFLLGYIRVKYGFLYACLTHGAYNLILTLPSLFATQGGGAMDQKSVILTGLLTLPLLAFMGIGFVNLIIDIVLWYKNRKSIQEIQVSA